MDVKGGRQKENLNSRILDHTFQWIGILAKEHAGDLGTAYTKSIIALLNQRYFSFCPSQDSS